MSMQFSLQLKILLTLTICMQVLTKSGLSFKSNCSTIQSFPTSQLQKSHNVAKITLNQGHYSSAYMVHQRGPLLKEKVPT
jgi:hypothetical protein